MNNVYLGLGSNLGKRELNIKKAIELLKKKCKILKISSLYETEPVGYKNQDWFLNCVVNIETDLNPKELLISLQSIEEKLKRIRRIKFGPRTIDLDILIWEDLILNENGLIIPHQRMHERLFVLMPFNEIAPNVVHPILKKKIDDLTHELLNS